MTMFYHSYRILHFCGLSDGSALTRPTSSVRTSLCFLFPDHADRGTVRMLIILYNSQKHFVEETLTILLYIITTPTSSLCQWRWNKAEAALVSSSTNTTASTQYLSSIGKDIFSTTTRETKRSSSSSSSIISHLADGWYLERHLVLLENCDGTACNSRPKRYCWRCILKKRVLVVSLHQLLIQPFFCI